MALKIEVDKTVLVEALEAKIAQHQRASNTAKNPKLRPIYEEDMKILRRAIESIETVK